MRRDSVLLFHCVGCDRCCRRYSEVGVMKVRRVGRVVLVAGVISLAGCNFIKTPTGPEYRYSWVMLHDHQSEGVQVGPKYDGKGSHWSVWWWVGCNEDYTVCAQSDYVLGDTLDSTAPHWYAIVECETGTWCPIVDGKVVSKVRLPYPPPIREVSSEVTTS